MHECVCTCMRISLFLPNFCTHKVALFLKIEFFINFLIKKASWMTPLVSYVYGVELMGEIRDCGEREQELFAMRFEKFSNENSLFAYEKRLSFFHLHEM